jgi:hypothetical protein
LPSSRVRTRLVGLSTALAPALVSCVWLLDFDGLQKGGDDDAPNDGGASGSSGTGGLGAFGGLGAVGGTAGSGGTGACPSECTDDDPCTLDGCTPEGECTTEPVLGLALDGVDETRLADAHGRTTIASASDAFFLSNLAIDGNASEVTFYRLDANAPSEALSEIATVGSLELGDAAPLSPAGLAIDTTVGRIHAFVGMLTASGGQRVWHVVFDMTYAVRQRTTVADTYWGDSPYHHPVVANFGGDIVAAWINANREVSLWTGALAGPATLAAGRMPMTLSLLASPENDPFVLYGVDGGGVFVEGLTAPVTGVSECQMRPGGYLSSAAASVGMAGFWLAYWTKFGEASGGEDGYLTTDGRGIVCTALGCGVGVAGDCSNAASNGTRNVAVTSAVRPGDPLGLVHLVQVTPIVGPDPVTQELTAGLIAGASRVDFGPTPFETEPEGTDLGYVQLSAMPTSLPGLAGPDWPVVAYVPPDRFAIAWTQPAPAAGSELRIQRYRLCAPD